MSDRIERLGELYDAAVERVDARTNDPTLDYSLRDFADMRQQWDMDVIRLYLEHVGRPEREPAPQTPESALLMKLTLLPSDKHHAIRDMIDNELAKL